MTVSVQTPFTAATANGVTTVFPYTFRVISQDDLDVTLDGVLQTTGFTVSGIGDDVGGNVTFSVAPASGVAVVLTRDPILERETDYAQFGKIPSDILNADFDRLWLALQYIKQLCLTAIKLPFTTIVDPLIEEDEAGRAGKAIGFDAAGQVALYDMQTGTSLVDLSASSGSSLIGHQPTTGAATTVQLALRSHEASIEAAKGNSVSVIDFGADPTGVADSTSAFNLATLASHTSLGNDDLNFPSMVYVPAGEYLISDTIYIHKGQHLMGAGEGATRIRCAAATGLDAAVFKMGYSAASIDAGGLPPEISGMFIEGPSIGTAIYCRVNGASIHNLFISYADVAIDIGGTDVRATNIQIDSGHTGLSIGGHNHIVSNVLFYFNDFASISTHNDGGTGCADITISDCQVYYPQARGVLLNYGVTHRDLMFDNINFFMNEQYAGFTGYVIGSSSTDNNITFNACTFANMKGNAVYSGGANSVIRFKSCLFEGTKTVGAYAQSTTAFAATIVHGRIYFDDCAFNNLLDTPIKVTGTGSAEVRVTVRGGSVENCAGTVFIDTAGSTVVFGSLISVRDVDVFIEDKYYTNATETNWCVETDRPMRTTAAAPYIVNTSTTFLDTSAGAVSIVLPRTDWGNEIGAKHGDTLTFIDWSGTWGVTNPGFLSGDNSINATGPGGTWNPPAGATSVTFTFNTTTNTWRAY